jgi:hypothetical protein
MASLGATALTVAVSVEGSSTDTLLGNPDMTVLEAAWSILNVPDWKAIA